MDVLEFVDDYEHIDKDLEYILENVLSKNVVQNVSVCNESKKLYELFNSLLLNKCDCEEGCHQQCPHRTSYIFNEDVKELVLQDNQLSPDLIYECSNICNCNKNNCQNRLTQYGPRKFLKIVYSSMYSSKGLITLKDIPKGAFICEYAGELITMNEAKHIIKRNEMNNAMNYVLYLKEIRLGLEYDASTNDESIFLTIINPSKKGNIGRYLNHSCDPNCRIVSVRVDSPIPKIAFFSRRFIRAGEELCFNYNEGLKLNMPTNGGIACLCNSKNCLKYLPSSEV